jgi:hypothetical protein
MASNKDTNKDDAGSDDDISITSTTPSRSDPENGIYTVKRILAESVSEDGKPLYLIEWEGYDLS